MSKQLLSSITFATVCLIWGTTWMAMEVAVESIPPIIATGIRFLISAPLLMVIACMMKQPLLFPKGKRKFMLAVAVFYFAIPFTLMIVGEQYISSGLASIIFANMPIAVLVVSMISLSLRLAAHQLFGLGMAVIALCLILSGELDMGTGNDNAGIVALVVAVLIHAVMYVLTQKHAQGIHVLTYNAMPSGIASVLLLVTGSFLEQPDLHHISDESVYAVVYLGLVASVIGIVAYFSLNQMTSPFTASLCFLIFPVVALLLDAWVNDNHLSELSQQLLLPLLVGIVIAKMPQLPEWLMSRTSK
ncbi:putative Permease of the drug/metabolite transporter (DMT) superfamily [Vibrio nigripulchritudo MADA3029]|uniref:DMT family transporter n=1 Tax=Vibrio nigripulchritudo TaxID=28173 RepID=UPI0003B23E9B|nr:DMT family transporter [Vibrio nigripulchritudo]CCN47852.1 putative Permease of the drug/metabolite transporter (DMT) superfamily [Vibrio nigripulchritudo MADA3020]CCN56329.1 putative Permease of the drug/metabolite transporter (DMT) superfamily [Vibrio nigripulchritudo MADA3021]CCN59296.1 putative Permease of the drug/metabolite transporter (DMT) superfamily [Vibrio nigripulchritudo MADA3029]